MSRKTSLSVMWAAYLWAIAIALTIGSQLPVDSPLVKAGIVDLIATVMIFAISVIFDNSSIYDPYWSVAPIVMTGYWVLSAPGDLAANRRALVVFVLVAVWGVRLTMNFLTHWKGMHQEDWRYVEFREKAGRFYWAVSFVGIHLVPSVIVFAGCVPIYSACSTGGPMGVMDVVAGVVTLSAIVIETVADAQMRAAVARGGDGTNDLPRRALGLLAPPQLLWRNHVLVGHVPLRPGGRPRILVDHFRSPRSDSPFPCRQSPVDRDPDGRAAGGLSRGSG